MSTQAAGRSTLPLERGQLRRAFLAPFGRYTRFRFRIYAQTTFLIASALLLIGLTIDVPPNLAKVLAQKPDATGIAAAFYVIWYMALRSADILTEIWPIAGFLGVFAAEFSHTRSRERLMIWNSGRSPAQCLVPLLLFGACLFGLQLALDLYLRPAAVAAQIEARLGDYGDWFDRKRPRSLWLFAHGDLIHAEVHFGPPLVMRDLKIYRLGGDGQLRAVVNARTARPARAAGEWLIEHGSRWEAAPEEGEARTVLRPQPPTPRGEEVPFRDEKIALGVDPLWLANYAIQPRYLPHTTLRAIANGPSDLYAASEFRTWVTVRYTRALAAVGLALLASCMALAFFAYRTSLEAIVGIAVAGYCAHVLMKVFVALGEYGYVPPFVAAWTVPVLLLLVCAALLGMLQRQWFATRGLPT